MDFTEASILVAGILIGFAIAVLVIWPSVPEPEPEPKPKPEPEPLKQWDWYGKVLHVGSSTSFIVPVRLSNGVMADARCKSFYQWRVTLTGDKVFGSIDPDGNYILEGKS